jgi:hypothetical protein
MAKFLLSALFFWFHLFVISPAFASEEPGNPEKISRLSEVCDAPAPDSFRITSIGGSFMTLAWKPAWEGATHVLYISQKDSSGGWTAQSVLPNVSGNTITVNGLVGGKEYRFRIATKCSTGEPSELTAFVDGIALILDLTIAGRTPKNPQPINCTGIEYAKYPWLGFRISGEGYSRLFEVKINGENVEPFGTVGRVRPENHIVASNMDFLYPNINTPVVSNFSQFFRILDVTLPTPLRIGLISINSIPGSPNKIDLCDVTNNPLDPWKNGYSFSALFAYETILIPPGGIGYGIDPKLNGFTVQNPMSENLNIFAPDGFINNGSIKIRFLDLNGKLVFAQEFDYFSNQVLIPLEGLSTGFYILEIQSSNAIEVHKVVKGF